MKIEENLLIVLENFFSNKLVTTISLLIKEVLLFDKPTDLVIKNFFRKKKCHQKERLIIVNVVYEVVRNKTKIVRNIKAQQLIKHKSLNYWLSVFGATVFLGKECVRKHLNDSEKLIIEKIVDKYNYEKLRNNPSSREISEFYSVPIWLVKKIILQRNNKEAVNFLEKSILSSNIFFRVNTIKTSTAKIMKKLKASGFDFSPSLVLPECLFASNKVRPKEINEYLNGQLEIQDLGSQLASRLVAPKKYDCIIDLCCGSGGKTLAIGSLMKNTGRIYAIDISIKKLKNLESRLKRSGLTNVWPIHINNLNDEKLLNLKNKADCILLDVPCSGFGTLRRNPDLKWRISPYKLEMYVKKQNEILRAASQLSKKGSYIVYVTCSILREENEEVVDCFLSEFPEFEICDSREILSNQGIQLSKIDVTFNVNKSVSLYTDLTNTDSFFMVKLKKV